jgi:hypothetical protein
MTMHRRDTFDNLLLSWRQIYLICTSDTGDGALFLCISLAVKDGGVTCKTQRKKIIERSRADRL